MKELAPPAAAELDAVHDEARAAFERRDLARYRELFASGLRYQQADGKVIGRDELMHDVADQFRRLDRCQSSFVREKIEFSGDHATEVLTQTATAGETIFFVLHRSWRVTRKGSYTWARHGGRWLIESVEIIEEQVDPGKLCIGLRPPEASIEG